MRHPPFLSIASHPKNPCSRILSWFLGCGSILSILSCTAASYPDRILVLPQCAILPEERTEVIIGSDFTLDQNDLQVG
jgi:hypothetical protein